MNAMLANLLKSDNPALRRIADGWVGDGPGGPGMLILLVGVVVLMLTAYYYWRWQKRCAQEPNARAVLRFAADTLDLSSAHRRLLWRLGRAAGLEPAVALVSPRLLIHLVRRSEQVGLELTGDQTLALGQILDAVSAAADAGAPGNA